MGKKAVEIEDGQCSSTTYWEIGEAEICKMADNMKSVTRKKCYVHFQTTKNTRPSNANQQQQFQNLKVFNATYSKHMEFIDKMCELCPLEQYLKSTHTKYVSMLIISRINIHNSYAENFEKTRLNTIYKMLG